VGLDTATEDSGRLALAYYRELTGSEFLDRIEQWHLGHAWLLPIFDGKARGGGSGRTFRYVLGAPSPLSIARTAYDIDRRGEGEEQTRLLRGTLARLMPCIIEGRRVPEDLVLACCRRAVSRMGHKQTNGREEKWETCLGIACALVRGSRRKEDYQMSLEENRTTRDYLFGRLLAIAENIEILALLLADEKRDTNAAKLMQRFADRPSSTWRTIELALTPYKARLRAKRPPALLKREKLMDSVIGTFKGDDFTNDSKLTSEFLLGYHCQRAALWQKNEPDNGTGDKVDTEHQGDDA
jgi:CRISPR-associated protein Csd1